MAEVEVEWVSPARPRMSTYARLHPLAISVAAGSVLLGGLLTIYPNTALTSPIAESVTGLGIRLWGAFFIVGGLAALKGLLTGSRPAESSGMSMLSTAYAASILPPIFDPGVPLSPLLIACSSLACGCLARAYGIASRKIP